MKKILVCSMFFVSFNLLATQVSSLVNPGPFASSIAGKIIEKIDVHTYTYLKLKTKSDETWVAVPKTDLAINAQVELMKPMAMNGFESKSLNRKFDRIYFGVLKAQTDTTKKSKKD